MNLKFILIIYDIIRNLGIIEQECYMNVPHKDLIMNN